MKAKFIGDPTTVGDVQLPETFTAFGVTFPRNKWVAVPDAVASKFAGNSHFETQDDEPTVGAPPAGRAPTNDAPLKAVHRGGGSYSIMRGDEPVEAVEKLSKDEAEAFNALASDDDREAFVAERVAPTE